MSSKTKIVVLHMREVIYTGIFLVLAVLLGVLMFFMFGRGAASGEAAGKAEMKRFTPGVYRETIVLGDNSFDVEVTVDYDEIKAIGLVNLSESTAAMFPLVEPALETLAGQIYQTQSLEGIRYGEDQRYTAALLLNCIENALKKAEN